MKIKFIKAFLIALVLIATIFTDLALAYKTDTHESMNLYIAANSINGFSFHQFLIDNIGFPGGRIEPVNEILVEDWLKLGGEEEDNWGEAPTFPRFRNHFHDPTKELLSEAGLWGFFNSAITWSQKPLSTQSWVADYSWHDVRDYYHKALTAQTNGDRNKYFADTFRGLGQLMHLIQDMSVPAHARDDGHWDTIYYESYVQEHIDNIGFYVDAPGHSVVTYNISNLTVSPFSDAQVPVARLFDSNDFTGSNPEDTTQPDIGLAEYTNVNFFSTDTWMNKANPTEMEYAYPNRQSAANEPVDGEVKDRFGVTKSRKYYQKITHGDTGYKLSATDYLQIYRNIYLIGEDYDILPVLDNNVYADYAGKLVPRAVGYSAALMQYFFRGDMDITDIGGTPNVYGTHINQVSFKVKNTSVLGSTPEPFGSGSLEFVYQYVPAGSSTPVFFKKTIYTSTPSGINSTGLDVTVDISTNPIPLNAAKKGFTVVYKGPLGAETGGVAAKYMDLDLLFTSRIAYYYQPGGIPNTSNIYTVLSNGTDQQQITNAVIPNPWYFGPSWSNDGRYLAFKKEECTDSNYVPGDFCDSSYGSDAIFVVDLELTQSFPGNLVHELYVEPSPYGVTTHATLPSFSPTDEQLVAVAEGSLSSGLVVFDLTDSSWHFVGDRDFWEDRGLSPFGYEPVVPPEWSPVPNGKIVYYVAEKRNFATGYMDPDKDIYTIDSNGLNETALTDDSFVNIYPSWSPDGGSIVFVSNRDGGSVFDIWLMDSDGNNKQKIHDCSSSCFSPSFSPDGLSLSFIKTGDYNLYKINVDGNPVVETQLTSHGFVGSARWSPYLLQ